MFNSPLGQQVLMQVRWVVVALGAFLVALTIGALMQLRYIGTGIAPANTISVSGEGKAFAVPDIGEFTYSVMSEKTTVAAAQADATAKANAITTYLKEAGVDEKDIKTTDYSVYPQYDYQSAACPQSAVYSEGGSVASTVYCPSGRQVLRGYQVRQTTDVKVRDTAKAGDLLTSVGSKGATEVSSLSFTVEDETAVENEARNEAIANAKKKADTLARELGVSLVRVVSFSENSGGRYPIYAKAYSLGGAADSSATPAPELSTGQNQYTSNVNIVYEIR